MWSKSVATLNPYEATRESLEREEERVASSLKKKKEADRSIEMQSPRSD